MKKLYRIKLRSAVQLESNEMKQIYGGSGTGGKCIISCKDGGVRDNTVEDNSCYDSVWPCGSGVSWSCTGC